MVAGMRESGENPEHLPVLYTPKLPLGRKSVIEEILEKAVRGRGHLPFSVSQKTYGREKFIQFRELTVVTVLLRLFCLRS